MAIFDDSFWSKYIDGKEPNGFPHSIVISSNEKRYTDFSINSEYILKIHNWLLVNILDWRLSTFNMYYDIEGNLLLSDENPDDERDYRCYNALPINSIRTTIMKYYFKTNSDAMLFRLNFEG